MTITIITMANTNPTTQTDKALVEIITIGVVLAFFAAINLFSTVTPVANNNEQIYQELQRSFNMPLDARLTQFSDLMKRQEKALSRNPSEPYGWTRLSYLRQTTTGNEKEAFEALRMSDLVSPYEAPQLVERALMWRKFHSVEDKDQQDYQDTLWVKAFTMHPQETWNAANKEGILNDVGQAIQRRSAILYAEWPK